jgi:hypothetical protein
VWHGGDESQGSAAARGDFTVGGNRIKLVEHRKPGSRQRCDERNDRFDNR